MDRSTSSPTTSSDIESQWLKDLKGCAPRSARSGIAPIAAVSDAPLAPAAARARAASSATVASSPEKPEERRHFARFKTLLAGMVSDQDMQSKCRILDLSLGGARIAGLSRDHDLPERFSIRIDRFGLAEGRLLWQHGDQAGVRFDGQPTTIAALFGAFVPRHCRQSLAPLAAS